MCICIHLPQREFEYGLMIFVGIEIVFRLRRNTWLQERFSFGKFGACYFRCMGLSIWHRRCWSCTCCWLGPVNIFEASLMKGRNEFFVSSEAKLK